MQVCWSKRHDECERGRGPYGGAGYTELRGAEHSRRRLIVATFADRSLVEFSCTLNLFSEEDCDMRTQHQRKLARSRLWTTMVALVFVLTSSVIAKGETFGRLGFDGTLRFAAINEDEAKYARLGIDKIHSGKPADAAGLKTNDVILSVDGKRFKSVKEFRKLLDNSDGTVKLKVLKDGNDDATEVKVKFQK
jgi:PDZ domain